MQALKPNDVLARVVAWHNRHPLARRIQPSQVHSIGAVSLPFAGAAPLPAAPAGPLTHTAAAPTAAAEPPTTAAAAAPAEPTWAEAPVQHEPSADPVAEGPPAVPADETVAQAAAATTDTTATNEQAQELAALPDVALPDAESAPPDTDAADNAAVPADADPTAEAEADADVGALAPADAPAADDPTADSADGLEAEFVMAGEPDEAAPTAVDSATPAPDASATEAEAEPSEGTLDPLPAPADQPQAEATEGAAAPLATRLQAARAAALSGEPSPTLPPRAAPAGAHAAPVTTAAAARPWWQRLWPFGHPAGAADAAGPAQQGAALKPLFSERFLWPLSPGQVARWARRHGALAPLAPADWPVRRLAVEPALLQQARAKGQRQTTQLHLLTAAIGVGDRRIRVLVGADGQVLGPRAIDRRRVAVVAGVALFMATVVASRWPQQGAHDPHGSEALASETAASAPAGMAAVVADAGASAAGQAPHESPGTTAEGPAPGDTGTHQQADASAAARALTAGTSAPLDDTQAQLGSSAALGAPAATTGPAPLVVTSTPPPRFPERRASGPLASIRPQLSDDARLTARQQSEAARAAARGETPPAGPANQRFAVVTLGSAQREPAEAYLAQLLSVRAQMPSPGTARTELVQQQGQWHAALWPFATAGDAERARTMLATRGLKTEVVAF